MLLQKASLHAKKLLISLLLQQAILFNKLKQLIWSKRKPTLIRRLQLLTQVSLHQVGLHPN